MQPPGVIYPTCPHSGTPHESKVNLILRHSVQMLRLTLALVPHSNTGQGRGLLSGTSACQVKSIKARGKNASGSVGLLKHSCTSEPEKKSAMSAKAPGEQREQNMGITFSEVSALPLSLAIFADFIQGRSSRVFQWLFRSLSTVSVR